MDDGLEFSVSFEPRTGSGRDTRKREERLDADATRARALITARRLGGVLFFLTPPSSFPDHGPPDSDDTSRDARVTPDSTDSIRSNHRSPPCFFLSPEFWLGTWRRGVVTMMSSPMVLSLLLFASLTALLLLAPRLSPPLTPGKVAAGEEQVEEVPAAGVGSGVYGGGAGVRDERDDLALFRRATLEAAGAGAPPKVAFLFLTNSDLTFAPLWERFFAGHEGRFTVYVHADPASRLRLPPTPSFRGRFVAAKPTRRADPSLIAAARRLLAAALLDDPANAYFALLSQSCVPLHSFPRLYAALFPPAARHRHRLPSYIEVLAGEPQMPSRYVARGEDAMLPEVPYDRFRIGSQFFTLARRHAALVVRERRLWRKFRLPCLPEARDSCYPEEHYFPTLLDMAADPAGLARYTLTRVNWTGSVAGHPHTYTAPEVTPRLIAELRASNNTHPYMFARKFAPDCLGPLLAIADTVIFKD